MNPCLKAPVGGWLPSHKSVLLQRNDADCTFLFTLSPLCAGSVFNFSVETVETVPNNHRHDDRRLSLTSCQLITTRTTLSSTAKLFLSTRYVDALML